MTSRFWTSWSKEEPKIRSSICPSSLQSTTKNREGNILRANHEFDSWLSEDLGRMKIKSTTQVGSDSDKVIGARLTNGKSSAAAAATSVTTTDNGSAKQVKSLAADDDLLPYRNFLHKITRENDNSLRDSRQFSVYSPIENDEEETNMFAVINKKKIINSPTYDDRLKRKKANGYHHPTHDFDIELTRYESKTPQRHVDLVRNKSRRNSSLKYHHYYDDNSSCSSLERDDSKEELCERDTGEYSDGKKKDRHSRPLTPPPTSFDHEVNHNCTTTNLPLLLSPSKDPYDNPMILGNVSWLDDKQLSSRYSNEKIDKFHSNYDNRENSNYSTIERNGTTVIRIRNNEASPTTNLMKFHHQPKKYRDEAVERIRQLPTGNHDDSIEDYHDFFNNRKRKSVHSSDIRHHPLTVQITDLEDGQPCLECGETCPGFSPHIWRKNCTSCKCPKEAHDVCHEEWVTVRARLGLKGDSSSNYVGFEPRERGLAWAPPGLPPNKVEEYFSMLPEISVPRLGTPGERHRDRQLSNQLPKQDLARAYCKHLDSQHSASADDFMAARNEIALDIATVQEVLERNQQCGTCHEPLKYGSLAVMASKLGQLYHPACFKCPQCQELLVDLAYCLHDNTLYCERHYAEQLKPRCAACDELIFSGEYTKAMNKDWHTGHFCCWQCDESLTGQRYVLRDEHPYCIKCYESIFANTCGECNKIIGIDSKDLSYKDKHWHEACFLCYKCRVSLVDKQFGSKADKIYCGNCYDAQFASRCDGCGEIFRAGTKKMEYKTRQWHEKCFCCVVCKNAIGLKSFIPREQEIYCAGCYEDKFATRCIKCNKIITAGGVTYKNAPWHRDCFTCTHCNNSLAGQRFTSRDDEPYCSECFGELFAKRCTSCTKPITGIGGTRFISFEDKHWHNDCFICAVCTTSLVGRGFIPDGDDIICTECAKAKLTSE